MNPSWEIAKALPPFLPPSKPRTTTASGSSVVADLPKPVRIVVHPEPVRVAYKTVRPLVPRLWEARKIDYMVHIGMASGRNYYSVERRGHRDGYAMKDVDNELLEDDERRAREGENWIWDGLPEELLSDNNIDDVWRMWSTALPVCPSQISTMLVCFRYGMLTEARAPIYGYLKMLGDICAILYITQVLHI